jgi:DNA-binding transcriptional regulator GbsR (MarR family)
VNAEERSNRLFGRYDALNIWAVVAALVKEQFTTGEVVALSGVGSSLVSKELKRLADVGLLRSVSRRGDYERLPSGFWAVAAALFEEWRTSEASG